MTTKKCFKCNIEWPLIFFYKQSGMKDGHLNKCKKCTKQDAANYRDNNIEAVRLYDAKRQKTPERRERKLVYTDNFREKNPEKYKAYTAVSNALRDKKLFKQPCCVCGESNSQAHHEDYSRPLDVIWVCVKHHREIE